VKVSGSTDMMVDMAISNFIAIAIVRYRSTRRTDNPWSGARSGIGRSHGIHIPLAMSDACEIDRWVETPVTFTNSRWLKPIDRFREDLYLYISERRAVHRRRSARALGPWARRHRGRSPHLPQMEGMVRRPGQEI
jgi:hypothetical protein